MQKCTKCGDRFTGEEISALRAEEQATLQDIAKIATVEFAEEAAGVLDSRKHAYSFETYLILLSNLKELLLAGVPPEYALNSVQTGWDTDRILSVWSSEEEKRNGMDH